MKYAYLVLLLSVLAIGALPATHAAYIVTGINTTVVLNQNTSAKVTDILKIAVTNSSVQQYTQDRIALNLTLGQWQELIGPALVQHILNPTGSAYDFNFLPGPLQVSNNGRAAYLYLSYDVPNVTIANQTGPRVSHYTFRDAVFNFEHAASGPVLGPNTTLTMILPAGSKIVSVYPLPDSPAGAFTQGYRNVTQISWFTDEPLSEFTLSYDVQQSLQSEVLGFFTQVYSTLGVFVYVLVAAAIAGFIIYTYRKANK